MLTNENVADYLVQRRVLASSGDVQVTPLTGGVSNDVFAVTGGDVNLVLKQAMSKLAVEEEWIADPRRILIEARALQMVGQITPDAVPAVIDVDDSALVICIQRASETWRNWKDDLLNGEARPEVASFLGKCLARWHSETVNDNEAKSQFDAIHFESLRIDPYHRGAAQKNPSVAARIEVLATELLKQKHCLVHGDFSPKNVLTGSDVGWVLDWEVAHYGNPVFDLAFLHAHLLLKAIHTPQWRDMYNNCAAAFADSYSETVAGIDDAVFSTLSDHVGCLLLARVDGKSPAEYLTDDQRRVTRNLALDALEHPSTLDALWKALT